MTATVLRFPAPAAPTPRALPSSSASFVLRQMMSVKLTKPEQLALVDCLVHPHRTHLEIAERHGIDRAHLQDLYFDLFTIPERARAAQDRSK